MQRHGSRRRVQLEGFTTAQRELMAFAMSSSLGIDASRVFCVECLDALERRILARQIVRDGGETFIVDLMVSSYPMMPTPMRLGAESEYRGRGVTMCFIDSGFVAHPDFTEPKNRIAFIYDAARARKLPTSPSRGTPAIAAWHGTMTSASAAGNGHMGKGLYRGVADHAHAVFIATMAQDGNLGTQQIVRALRWVVRNHERFGIRVVSISVGGDDVAHDESHPVLALVEEIVANGVVVVAASGNGPDRPLMPPASSPFAITVGGIDDRNTTDPRAWRLWYGSYGRDVSGASKPDLLAPSIWIAAPILLRSGVKREAEALFAIATASDVELMRVVRRNARATIVGSLITRQRSPRLIRSIVHRRMLDEKLITASYKHVDGTSFAAPLVSSVVAQIFEVHPDLTPAEVRQILVVTALRLPHVPPDQQGAGVIQAKAAVDMARAMR